MKKRIILLLLSCFFLLLLSLPAGATEYGGSCGNEAYWKLDTQTGLLTIYGSGTVEQKPWEQYKKQITSVVVENGITEIPGSCFAACTSLTDISLPESVSVIGAYAFQDCTALKEITLPEGTTEIFRNTFENCYALEKISIPKSLQKIWPSAFSRCYALESISLPDGMKSIGEKAFYGCADLNEIKIPAGIEKIEASTFESCTELRFVHVPPTLKACDKDAFKGCEALETVYIQDLDAWCGISFYGIANDWQGAKRSPDIFASPMHYAEDIRLNGESIVEAAISEGVTTIGTGAFYGWDRLKSVTLPDSVATLGSHCFAFCPNLETVRLPKGYAQELRSYTFYDCKALRQIELPQGVGTIGASCFQGCSSLESITLPEALLGIREDAFYGCSALRQTELPEGLLSIGNSAFAYCESLMEVYIPDQVQSINAAAFTHCTELRQIRLGSSVLSLGNNAFSYCRKLYSIVIPENLEMMTNVFFYCHNLRKVYILNPNLEKHYKNGDITVYSYPGSASQKACQQVNASFGILCQDSHPCDCYTSITAATCTKEGTYSGTCMLCSAAVTERVPATGHNMVDNVCTDCGYTKPFSDIPENAWYSEAVSYAVSNGLMNGVGNNRFDPEGSMTRAMLVTVLWRYEGERVEGSNIFTDVKSDQWYSKAVVWAAYNGVVGGVGNGKFDPDGKITREQLATILYRYSNFKAMDTSARADLSAFSDASKVSSYAQSTMQWAVASGLINGSEGMLMPRGYATRAQVAAILMRYIENVAE